MENLIKFRLHRALYLNYEEPVNRVYFYYLKAIIAFLWIWKILSRDFSNIAIWPASVLSGYPIDIYPPDYFLVTAVPPFFDVVTFHFIHYALPLPGAGQLLAIQYLAVGAGLFFVVANERYTQVAAIAFYIPIAYLWGFVFRLGQEIDAVFLLQGALLVFALLHSSDSPKYLKNIRFLTICIFVLYYFTSGLNKVVDLSYSEWLKYDLVEINREKVRAFNEVGFWWVPQLPLSEGRLSGILNAFGALLTYLVHLMAPLLLISRSTLKILSYWFFYTIFHFMTIYVGIMFTMNFLAWLMLLPVYKLKLGAAK